jgi:8-oxo-dGTP pyrophosphatase MutT (NUDIX family)
MEFIRGKYDIEDIDYIKHLMGFMTETERKSLVFTCFDDLWNQVWYQPFMPKQTQEYQDAKEKFTKLKQGYYRESDILVTITTLLSDTSTKYKEPEWGFPKGRRRLKERDIDCAVREFCEETGFTKQDIELHIDREPYEEIFYGTNHIQYRHVYYIAKVVHNVYKQIVIDQNNPHQAREVRQVKWFSGPEVLERIREHNIERKELFTTVTKKIETFEDEQP